jgi:hypothetical protein
MSTEAQFYEARRRQSAIERRLSLRSQQEIHTQAEPQYLCIPIRIVRQEDKNGRCTCMPMRRMSLGKLDSSLFQRDRDIYP